MALPAEFFTAAGAELKFRILFESYGGGIDLLNSNGVFGHGLDPSHALGMVYF